VQNYTVCMCDVGMWYSNWLDLEVVMKEEGAFRWLFEWGVVLNMPIYPFCDI
jgi:hypothetical protein